MTRGRQNVVTTPAVEPPAQGALYGRVVHASGTAAPRAAVGLRQWQGPELLLLAMSGGLSCAVGACAEPRYLKQTPEGTYSFPADWIKGDEFSVVADWGDQGVSVEVFMEDGKDPQRVPDLVLWEPELKLRRIGDGVLVTWPRYRPGAVYTLYSQKGRISPSTLATSRLIPGRRVDGELFVEVRTKQEDVRYEHRTARFPAPPGRRYVSETVTLTGRDCLVTQGRNRVVLRFGDRFETSDDGVNFQQITVPQPRWGVRTTTVNAKYVCGREVGVW